MGSLDDKVVLITGAAGGIGSAVAAAIARAGGRTIVTDLAGREGVEHSLDVTLQDDWLRVIAEIERTVGHLDGLVNAAGVAMLGSIEDTDLAAWRRIIGVNLDGTFLGCKHALPLLRRKGGAIVNMSSVYGRVGRHNLAAYNASKGGVEMLTKSVALYGASCNPKVRCNSVCPAFLDGPMIDALAAETNYPDIVRRQLAIDIPLGRLGHAAEVGKMCVYLLSDDASFITGSDITIDGGLTAR
jgi:3(or 17)beta-hydroxysteroid dehydrogenase